MMKSMLTLAGLSLGITACAASYDQASEAPKAQPSFCSQVETSTLSQDIFSPERVVSTRPIYKWFPARYKQTVGVEILVTPQAGESEAWVERAVVCEASTRAGVDDRHPLGVEGVDITVETRGPYFLVRLTSTTLGSGSELATRAEHLQRG